MFKIEFLSSYTLSFRVGVLCYNLKLRLRLSPAPTFRALKKYELSDVTFLMHVCEYRMT